ncbi:HU family DNA-binding protein [Rheinheimera sp. MMS21-TC3]|uniref:HU family DNA-binding protein n=1 Tax=Rheinheimera sp. MMS21-TC3 TaxID=3072790 RepID=UPI00391EF94B
MSQADLPLLESQTGVIASRTDITKADAARFVEQFCSVVTEELAQGGQVQLTGFGNFNHHCSRQS